MNEWQAAKQIQSTVRGITWEGGNVLFPAKSVKITAGVEFKKVKHMRCPIFLLKILTGSVDPEHHDSEEFSSSQFQATVFTKVAGDAVGEHAIMGANRQGDSRGAGLLEVQAQLFTELKLLNALEGFSLQLLAVSRTGMETDAMSYVAHRSYLWAADLTLGGKHYPAASGLTAVVVGGNVTLAWVLPTLRYDLVGAVLRRASGSTAPAAYNAGTGVTLASQLDTSVVDTPGSGTWSYALFIEYADGTTNYSTSVVQEGVVVA